MSYLETSPPPGAPAPPRAERRTGMRLIGGEVLEQPHEAEAYLPALAGRLYEWGVRPGCRVLLKADNSTTYVLVLLALMRLDTSIVLVDSQQTAQATRSLIATARVEVALVDEPEQAPADLPVCSLRELADGLRTSAAPGTSVSAPTTLAAPNLIEDWYARSDALVLWSSGSTGEPKGVLKSGRAFMDNLRRTRQLMGYRQNDVLLPILPFSHQYGLSLVLLAWSTGCTLLVPSPARLDRALALGGRWGATVVDATPVTYRSMLNLFRRRPRLRTDLSRVRLWCTGGAPSDQELRRSFPEHLGAPLLDGYGSTEAGNVAFATPEQPTGCGRLLDGVEIEVLDESGARCAAGQVGELWVTSPDLLTGYLTPDRGVAPQPKGPYRTGDLGYLDEDGCLFVLGRRFAVHRWGHTLYPEVLERKAEQCGRPVKIVPMDDARRGHELVFVVEDPAGGSAPYWRRRICAALAPFEHPNHVMVLPRFPVTRNGKPDSAKLTEHVFRSRGRPDQTVVWREPTEDGGLNRRGDDVRTS